MAKYIVLKRTGDKMPCVGLGTWKSKPGEVGASVRMAIEVGYRLIDCAAVYGNEREVGDALRTAFADGLVKRDDLFVTSKLWNNAHSADRVRAACQKTLSDLKLSYLDLYLIHWPVSDGPTQVPVEETWAAMESLVREGLVRNIGVANFTAKKMSRILAGCTIPPAVDQVEMTPLLPQKSLREFCAAHDIAVTAYSSLGSNDSPFRGDFPNILADETVKRVAAKHGKTAAQVLLGWALHMGVAVIPKSVHRERLAENLACTEVVLDAEDMGELAKMDRNKRTCGKMFADQLHITEAEFWDNE